MKLACENCAQRQMLGKMVLRVNRVKGTQFYGCSNYPSCEHTLTRREYDRICWSLIGDYPDDLGRD